MGRSPVRPDGWKRARRTALAAPSPPVQARAKPDHVVPPDNRGHVRTADAATADRPRVPAVRSGVSGRSAALTGGHLLRTFEPVHFGRRGRNHRAGGSACRSDEFFIGGAYEISKHDPHELYRLATLQQVRAESRRYFPTGRDVVPFLLFGLGVAAYGNELSVETFGPTGTLGAGVEIQLVGPVLVCSLAYRPMLFQAWTDPSMPRHDAGVAHFLAFEVGLEAQDRM